MADKPTQELETRVRVLYIRVSTETQSERENICQRTRMGMLERVKQGCWMGGGGVTYGYDYDRIVTHILTGKKPKKIIPPPYIVTCYMGASPSRRP